MSRPRVIVLALDAASPDLVSRWSRDGVMPNVGALLERGLSGSIRGLDGYFIGSTWPSLYTGTHPARHGFHYQQQLIPGTYELGEVADGEPTRSPPFWRRLSQSGRRVAVLDVPLSRLDPAMNGIQVVEWGSHDELYGHGTLPSGLKSEIATRFGPHLVGAHCDDTPRMIDGYCEFTERLLQSITIKSDLTRHLLAREPWDFFMQVFSESHCVGHQCWHLHDVNHPAHDATAAAVSGDPMRRVYAALDRAVGEILADAGDSTVIVLSAHGMTHWYGVEFLLRDVLVQLGAATQAAPEAAPGRGARDVLMDVAGAAWRALPPNARRGLLPLRNRLQRPTDPGPRSAIADLEPSLSRCFPLCIGLGTSGIRLNVVGREPRGLLRPGADLEAFVASLTADLLALEEASSGTRLVTRVLRTAELGTGACLDELPDLVVEWSRDFAVGSSLVSGGRGSEVTVRHARFGTVRGVNRYGQTGEHAPDGWFVASGPSVPRGRDCDVSILDLAPTFCRLLGVRDDGFDGVPIERLEGQADDRRPR